MFEILKKLQPILYRHSMSVSFFSVIQEYLSDCQLPKRYLLHVLCGICNNKVNLLPAIENYDKYSYNNSWDFFCVVNIQTNDMSHHLSKSSYILFSSPLNGIQLILFDIFPLICTSVSSKSAQSGSYYTGNSGKSEAQKFVL